MLGCFVSAIGIFALCYTLFPQLLELNDDPLDVMLCEWLTGLYGEPWDIAHFGQMAAFSASTMVTLGFSNINVATTGGPNMAGMVIVTLNLLVGYFMLAVLVTRLAILFQTMGPGYVVSKEDKAAKVTTQEAPKKEAKSIAGRRPNL